MSSSRNLSRRHFLLGLGGAGLGVAASGIPLHAQGRGQDLLRQRIQAFLDRIKNKGWTGSTTPPRPASTKSALTPADFTFLGAFNLPVDVGSGDPQWGTGLAHRYVNNELHFFSRAHSTSVYEVALPALSANLASARTAPLVKMWGDIAGSDSNGTTFGLFWDDDDQRLYWSNGNTYNTTSPYDPSIGFCTLDDARGQFTRHGVWALSDRSCKMTMGGVLAVPDWFAASNCPGMRLAAGFGGYFSIVATGPASMGPALTAFNPSDFNSAPSRSAVANTPLVGYPFNATPYTTPDRCHRDTNYTTEYDGWNPRNGTGYWSWSDFLWQGAVWVDTPTKSGLLFFPTLGNGRTWYQNSTLNAQNASHWWFAYSPDDLAQVAAGIKQQWQVQPNRTWQVQYPGVTYPLPRWSDEPAQMVVGSTFDAISQTLYVAVRFARGVYAGSAISVFAYRVGGTTTLVSR